MCVCVCVETIALQTFGNKQRKYMKKRLKKENYVFNKVVDLFSLSFPISFAFQHTSSKDRERKMVQIH